MWPCVRQGLILHYALKHAVLRLQSTFEVYKLLVCHKEQELREECIGYILNYINDFRDTYPAQWVTQGNADSLYSIIKCYVVF